MAPLQLAMDIEVDLEAKEVVATVVEEVMVEVAVALEAVMEVEVAMERKEVVMKVGHQVMEVVTMEAMVVRVDMALEIVRAAMEVAPMTAEEGVAMTAEEEAGVVVTVVVEETAEDLVEVRIFNIGA